MKPPYLNFQLQIQRTNSTVDVAMLLNAGYYTGYKPAHHPENSFWAIMVHLDRQRKAPTTDLGRLAGCTTLEHCSSGGTLATYAYAAGRSI